MRTSTQALIQNLSLALERSQRRSVDPVSAQDVFQEKANQNIDEAD